jgi:hypothetical protein
MKAITPKSIPGFRVVPSGVRYSGGGALAAEYGIRIAWEVVKTPTGIQVVPVVVNGIRALYNGAYHLSWRQTPTDIIIKDHLGKPDLEAARIESEGGTLTHPDGTPVTRPDGRPFNHVQEVADAQRGLLNRIERIQRLLSDSTLSPQERAILTQELSEASKMLDYTEKFLPR